MASVQVVFPARIDCYNDTLALTYLQSITSCIFEASVFQVQKSIRLGLTSLPPKRLTVRGVEVTSK